MNIIFGQQTQFEYINYKGIKSTRNVYQVLGLDLKTPSCVLFCYAQPTKNRQGVVTGVKGGTNTTVQLAMKHDIPIYNFYLQEDIDKVKSLMENYKV